MIQKNYKEYSIKQCKNFGYTFSIIFLIVGTYLFISFNSVFFLLISIFFFLMTLLKASFFRFFGFYWEKFGIFLGKFSSPIILLFVYLITVIPINLIIRILRVDILKKKKSNEVNSYWEIRKNKKINFTDQF